MEIRCSVLFSRSSSKLVARKSEHANAFESSSKSLQNQSRWQYRMKISKRERDTERERSWEAVDLVRAMHREEERGKRGSEKKRVITGTEVRVRERETYVGHSLWYTHKNMKHVFHAMSECRPYDLCSKMLCIYFSLQKHMYICRASCSMFFFRRKTKSIPLWIFL